MIYNYTTKSKFCKGIYFPECPIPAKPEKTAIRRVSDIIRFLQRL